MRTARTELKIGSGTLVARDGCFKKKPGTDKFTTQGDVRVNGIDIYTPGAQGSSARSAAKVTITIDKSARTLITEGGKVEVKVGNVVLDKGAALEWKIPSGERRHPATSRATRPRSTPASSTSSSSGLEVLGQTQPKLLQGRQRRDPGPPGAPDAARRRWAASAKITGDITLRADVKKGLKLSGLHIHADHVGIGIAEIDPLDIEYIGDPSKLYGKVNLLLPVIESALETEFQFTDGRVRLRQGRADAAGPGDRRGERASSSRRSTSGSSSTRSPRRSRAGCR